MYGIDTTVQIFIFFVIDLTIMVRAFNLLSNAVVRMRPESIKSQNAYTH